MPADTTKIEALQAYNKWISFPYDPAVPLLDIYSKQPKSLTHKDTCTPMFIETLFIIAKIGKQFKCPSTDEWIKMGFVYTQWNITQPSKRVKLCYLQQHRWTWRVLCLVK